MFTIDKYMFEKNQVIKEKNETKNTKKTNFFLAHFSERWENHEPLSHSARCLFLSLEHSQVLTFFIPGFALLYAINMGFYILTWYFGERKPGVKGFLESLST